MRQYGHQSLRVEHRMAFEHEIDGAGQLDGQDGVGLELVAVHPRFQPLIERSDDLVIAFGDDGCFAKGPTQIRVAQFGPAQALDLASAGHRPFDQPAIRQEVFDRGKTPDVAGFIEDGHAQVFADARHGLQQSIVALGVFFGKSLELSFQRGDLRIVMADQSQVVLQRQLAYRIGFLGQELLLPGIAVGPGLTECRAIVRQLMGLDAGQQFGPRPDVVGALPQQSAQRPFVGGIDVGGRDEVGAQQVGQLFGIEAVVLVLAAVNGFEVEGMGQHEVQACRLARIGQPIPAEHTLGADRQIVTIRLDQFEEVSEVVVADVGMDQLFTLPIHQADVHLMSMEIDSAVELCGGGVILHNVILHG